MQPLLSVIVPCFNEAEVLWETHGRLSGALSRLDDLDYEIIYVDDGSRDATPDMLREIQAIDPRALQGLRSDDPSYQAFRERLDALPRPPEPRRQEQIGPEQTGSRF